VIYDALARFHDGHLTYHPPSTAAPSRGYTSFRLGLRTVMGKEALLVSEVEPGGDIAAAGVLPGDEVIEIDGRPTQDVLGATVGMRASSSARSSMTSFAKTWTAVLVPKGDKPRARKVQIRHRASGEGSAAGATVEVAIAPREAPKVKHEVATVAGDADVAVVTIRSLEGGKQRAAEIEAALAKARTAKALVLDLRGNRGGVDIVGFRVVAGLAEGKALLARYRVLVAPETIARRPRWKSLEGTGDADGFSPVQELTVDGLAHGFKGKLAVVVDASCVSTCEVVASALRADLGAKLVGETTGASSGAPVSVTLPTTRGSVSIPTWDLVTADGQPIEDEGVHPDVEVYATPDALAAGTDLPLQQAIDLVRTP
jgi:C-terminal processing protease CtpA/Prc